MVGWGGKGGKRKEAANVIIFMIQAAIMVAIFLGDFMRSKGSMSMVNLAKQSTIPHR